MKRLLHHLVFAATLTAFVLPPSIADAAFEGYVTVDFAKQGKMKGTSAAKGQQGKVRVLSFSHQIVSPRDAASGLATGKRQHKPITLQLDLGEWAPQLTQALVTNENIKSLELGVMVGPGKGVAYTIALQNAQISSISLKGGGDEKPTLEVSFVYQKITWTWVDGGITSQDDWEAPVAAAAPPKKPK